MSLPKENEDRENGREPKTESKGATHIQKQKKRSSTYRRLRRNIQGNKSLKKKKKSCFIDVSIVDFKVSMPG